MQSKYFYDTNIFIYYFNDENAVQLYFDEDFITKNEIYFSVINEIELLSFPKITSEEITAIKNCLFAFNKIFLTDSIVNKTIELKKNYNLGIGDAIIAASALDCNAFLVTRNEKDFSKIHNLKIINPFNIDEIY